MSDELIEAIPVEDMEAAYREVLPLAEALAEDLVISFPGEAELAHYNIKTGTKAVLGRQTELAGKFTAEEMREIAEAIKVAVATMFAVRQVDTLVSGSTGEIAEKMARIHVVRLILLLGAKACALAGHIPMKEVEVIERGKGPRDHVGDAVSLAAFYRKYAAELENRTPATPELVQEAATLGTELLAKLRPTHAPKKTRPEELKAAVSTRDRFWTLLVQHHELVWKAGAQLFGREVDEHVPALLSRKRSPKPAEVVPPPPGSS